MKKIVFWSSKAAQFLGLMGAVLAPLSARGAVTLNWSGCLEEAASQNPEIKAAVHAYEASGFAVGVARSGYFPKIAGTLSTSVSKVDTSIASGQREKSAKAAIEWKQNLFNGFRDLGAVNQAESARRVQEIGLREAKASVSFDLKSAYSLLLFYQRSVRLSQEIVQRREGNLRLVELRFESGRENRGSVLLSTANLHQAKFELLQARNGIEAASAQLARVLGRDEDTLLAVADDLPQVNAGSLHPDFKALAQSSPEVLKAVAQEDQADAIVQVNRSGFYPAIDATGSYGKSDTQWFPKNKEWTIGVSLSLPIFSGGKDFYGSRQASAALKAASSKVENVTRDLLFKLKQAHTNYLEAGERLLVDQSFREAAVKRSEIAAGKYNNGLLSFEDWVQIENERIQREQSLLKSQRDLVVSEAAWEQIIGKGVIP